MTVYKPINFVKRYGKFVCYLLFFVFFYLLSTLVGNAPYVSGQQSIPGIVIRKVTEPAVSIATQFNFRASPALRAKIFSLGNGQDRKFSNVSPNTIYTVTEMVPSDWAVSATCDNGDNPTTGIRVGSAPSVTCTFINKKRGEIVIRKITVPAPDTETDFSFTVSGGLALTQFMLKNHGTRTFSNLTSGSGYSVAETIPAGWVQSSATCDNGSPVTNITVNPGESVICTFTNTKLGTLIVRKATNPNPDPTQSSFGFIAGGGLSPTAFSLKNGATQDFPDLTPGAGYSVSELPAVGWQTSAACSDNSPVTNINISPGETVTCTFTNRNATATLALSVSDGDVTIRPGERLTYTLTYTNSSFLDTPTVALIEQVPKQTSFVGPNGPNSWECAPDQQANASCVYTLGTVAQGTSGQVTFIVQVNPTAPAGVDEISNRATIGTAILSEIDADTEKTPLDAAPDLHLSKSDGDNAVAPGGIIIYSLSYKNQGNQGATGVVLAETVPEHSTFDSSASSSGWSCSGASCQLEIGALAAGAGDTVNFAVKVDNPLPAGVTQISNSASIADDGGNGSEPTPNDNLATDQTPVDRTFQLLATKVDTLAIDADNDGVYSPGDTVEYVVTIRNASSVGVRNVIFTDTPDANSTLLAGIQSGQGLVMKGNGSADTRVEIALGDLAGNSAAITIRFRVRINSSLPLQVDVIQNQGLVSSNDFATVATDDPDTVLVNDATITPLRAFARLNATLVDYLFVDSDGNEVVSLGDILIYRLTMQNTGNSAAGGIQVESLPGFGLALLAGSVSTNLGTVGHGNGIGDATFQVDIPLLPVGESARISYQMQIIESTAATVQTQATITVQSGLVTGPGQLTSDDPDIAGESDATVTTLGAIVAKLQTQFLPLIAKR